MAQLVFFLGATHDLALAELRAVLARLTLPHDIHLWSDRLATVSGIEATRAEELQSLLGGTFKIAEVLTELPAPVDETELFDSLVAQMEKLAPRSFVVAEHGRDHLPVIDAQELKNRLEEAGIRTRYKDAPRPGASAALLRKRKTHEFHCIQLADQTVVAHTVSVQDVDAWSHRDMDRPARDRKRGMLAPKLARMMLNIGLGEKQPGGAVLLDPFCGTGTILLEATNIGIATLLGADIDTQAILQTEENLRWWKSQSPIVFTHELVNKQVAELRRQDFHHVPTLIVTEPFLGKLTPKPEQVPGIIRGLEKLYRGMLRHLADVLEPGSRMVILLPSFVIGKRTLTVSETLKSFTEFGFVPVGEALPLSRPDSVTQRSVYVLEYKTYGTR